MNLYQIGQKIEHGPAYPMTCSERFHSIWDDNLNHVGRTTEPQPLFLSGTSYIIGLKMAIMDNYKYIPSKTYEGEEPEVVPAYAIGKREECLVCIKDIKKFQPYLVRKKDIK